MPGAATGTPTLWRCKSRWLRGHATTYVELAFGSDHWSLLWQLAFSREHPRPVGLIVFAAADPCLTRKPRLHQTPSGNWLAIGEVMLPLPRRALPVRSSRPLQP